MNRGIAPSAQAILCDLSELRDRRWRSFQDAELVGKPAKKVKKAQIGQYHNLTISAVLVHAEKKLGMNLRL